MARSLRNSKKQTRLQFASLPDTLSSSAAQDFYSTAVRDRLANVRYSGAKVRQSTPNKSRSVNLPTPEPSSAIRAGPSSSLSSPPVSPTLSAYQTPSRTNITLDDDVDADEDEDDAPLPSSKRRKVAENSTTTAFASSPRRSTRLNASSPLQLSQHTRTARTHASAPSVHSALSDIGSPETSGDNANRISTQPLRRRRKKPAAQDNDPFIVDDDHVSIATSEDHTIPVRHTRRPVEKVVEDFMVEDDEVEYITSDDEVNPDTPTRKPRKTTKRKSAARSRREQEELEEDLLDLQDTENTDDDGRSRTRGGPVTTQRDEMRTHLQRLKAKRAKKGSARLIISDEDEDEDGDDYDVNNNNNEEGAAFTSEEDTVNAEYISRPRHVGNESYSLIGAPEPNPESFDDHGDVDEDVDDFIVEDIEPTTSSRSNRPHPDIPLQFTSFASAKPKELFIHIIEWLVKNKISPAFSRNDDLYDLSFNRLDDQVKAQAGSRLISSAWGSTFKYAILARPVMAVEALPGLDEDHIRTCDACNRTNHPARYDFRLTGTPYNNDTLEPLEADDEQETDETSHHSHEDLDAHSEHDGQAPELSGTSYDSQGHLLAKESTHFYLGRYCAAAAEMGHKLTHWKHHLNTEVLTYLSEQGVLSAEEIVRRDKQSHKKREKEAENIVDAMADTGVIRELWRRFQDNLDDARWGMEGHESKSGKGRSKQRVGSVRVTGADGRIGEWMEGGRYKELDLNSDSDA